MNSNKKEILSSIKKYRLAIKTFNSLKLSVEKTIGFKTKPGSDMELLINFTNKVNNEVKAELLSKYSKAELKKLRKLLKNKK